jgi:hypothetical protein
VVRVRLPYRRASPIHRPYPALEVEIRGIGGRTQRLLARIDTGADTTIVPEAVLYLVAAATDGALLECVGYDGASANVELYRLQELTVLHPEWPDGIPRSFQDLEVGSSPRFPDVLLGRDVLDHWRITLDGPAREMLIGQ